MSSRHGGADPDPRLVGIAEAIAEGWTVDWGWEEQAFPEGGEFLETLRILQSISVASRSTNLAGQSDTRVSGIGTWGRLSIRAKLGEGAFGEVYRAYDSVLDREVALKVARANDVGHTGRFVSEARRLARIRHPNVLVVHGAEVLEGRVGIWTDLLHGKTLAEYLESEGLLGSREAALIGIDLCRALAAVHKEGIVHRDLKASNVMRESGGRIVLMDFGSGGDLRAGQSDSKGHAYGTPLFMAPEQLRGGAVDERADIYSLGVLLYHAVAGEYPISAASLPELMEQHLKARAIPLRSRRPDLPSDFVQAIDRSVHPDPVHRFQTVGEMERELSASIGSGRSASGAVVRRPWVVAGVLIVIVAGLLALNVGGSRDRFLGGGRVAGVESILALPSETRTPEEDAFLTDAIPRTLSTYLSQIQGLETMLPPTSLDVARVKGDLKAIAKAYGVEVLVLSAVTVQGDELHLSVQLVEADTRRMLWSQEYEGHRRGYLELIRRAAEGLRDAIRPAAAPVGPGARVAGESEAEIAFQRGSYFSNRYNNQHVPEDFERARASFLRVLELDPRHYDAAAEIGWLSLFRLESGAPMQESLSQMEKWAVRALQINPRSGSGMALLAWESYHKGNVAEFQRLSLRAVTFSPRDARCLNGLGYAFWYGGSLVLGLEALTESSRLEPLYLYPNLNASAVLAQLGRERDALQRVDQVLQVEPGMPYGLVTKTYDLALLGRSREAAESLDQLARIVAEGRFRLDLFERIGQLVAIASGRAASSRDLLDSLIVSPEFLGSDLAIILARLDRRDQALEALVRSGTAGEPVPYDMLMLNPGFDRLRRDPGFAPIAASARSRFEGVLQLIERSRAAEEFPSFLDRPLADLLSDLGMPSHP